MPDRRWNAPRHRLAALFHRATRPHRSGLDPGSPRRPSACFARGWRSCRACGPIASVCVRPA